MSTAQEFNEGDKCPYFGPDCCGRLELKEPKDCYCHLSAPCHYHEELGLICNDCGWNTKDGIDAT